MHIKNKKVHFLFSQPKLLLLSANNYCLEVASIAPSAVDPTVPGPPEMLKMLLEKDENGNFLCLIVLSSFFISYLLFLPLLSTSTPYH